MSQSAGIDGRTERPESVDELVSQLLLTKYSGHGLTVWNVGKRIRNDPRSQLSWFVGICECGSSSPLEPSNGHAAAWHYRHLTEMAESEGLI